VLFPLGCLAAGFVIGQVTDTGETSWFQQLTRPTYQPPDWAFPVAWTLLYLLMGLAAWRVWRKLGWAYGRGLLILFAAQLVLNLAWTPVFFAGQSIIGGLIVIVPLLILVAATTVAFRMVDALAGLLMTPYMLWVAFACLLNVHIYILN
jgi:tryptophan-rich sensory protein